ncbi:hypothetical protein BJY52DRAFT_1355948 [Lactarius psammicola]|nr:hypothetical protein BJY52DRAFT_1355948 [Lactarius psammicola]
MEVVSPPRKTSGGPTVVASLSEALPVSYNQGNGQNHEYGRNASQDTTYVGTVGVGLAVSLTGTLRENDNTLDFEIIDRALDVHCQTSPDPVTGPGNSSFGLKNHASSWPFRKSVKLSYATYYDVIERPMEPWVKRWEADKYASLEELADDAQLIFDNCQFYTVEDSV